jgi:exopolysaccharide biosynthesis polyprenyl glycosylphosphotransferase
MKNPQKRLVRGETVIDLGQTDTGNVHRFPSNPPALGADGLRLLDDKSFHTIISLERQRCDRAHKAYALVLVAVRNCPAARKREDLLETIAATLTTLSRDTDLTGWYEAGSIVGVILTDIVAPEKEAAISTIRAKVEAALREDLTQEQLSQISISINAYPEDWQLKASRRPSNPVLYPDLASRDRSRKLALMVKGMMDASGSVIALVLSAPLFLLIAIAIKLTSRGPVFFRQERVGQHGRPFMMLKFRSMCVDNDPSVHQKWFQNFHKGKAEKHAVGNGNGSYKLPNDPRVTRVGRLLRRTSMDELPQFINVLNGEMSLVGPRPPIPYEVDAYDAWHRGRVLEAKPGITGLWQVSGRSRVPFDEMVRMDLKYARTWSLWLDIKILLKTPGAVLNGEGAY